MAATQNSPYFRLVGDQSSTGLLLLLALILAAVVVVLLLIQGARLDDFFEQNLNINVSESNRPYLPLVGSR